MSQSPSPARSDASTSSSSDTRPHPHPKTPNSDSSSPTASSSTSTSIPPRLSALQFDNVIQPVLNSPLPFSAFLDQPPVKPEKCLTFCSQRNDAPPLCRMFCLRRRAMRTTQAENLAKLRPKALTDDRASVSSSSSSSSSAWTWRTPFEGLGKRLEPYSFIYARGTPDGVVGRYMEELEFDDGIRDFGDASRGVETRSRKTWEDDKLEVMDWGTEGALIHLPLTSIFYPVLTIPKTLTYIFTPLSKFVHAYQKSFTDGSQQRSLDRFTETVQKGGALTLLKQMGERAEKKAKERAEQIKAQREKEGKEHTIPGITNFKDSSEKFKHSAAQVKEKGKPEKGSLNLDLELEKLKQRHAKRSKVVKVNQDLEAKEE